SSRRRHTRSTRDWSSDVCSSDLVNISLLAEQTQTFHETEGWPASYLFDPINDAAPAVPATSRTRKLILCLADRARVSRRVRLRQIGRASCREGAQVGESAWVLSV